MPHELSLEEIGRIYITLMEEMKVRHEALVKSLLRIAEEEAEDEQFLLAEFAYLQVRRICELLALAVLAAHNTLPEARASDSLRLWNAEAVFKRLGRINPLGFPRPFVAERQENGGLHFNPIDRPLLDREGLCRIYNQCGDRLHVGKLGALLKGDRKVYDIAELRYWCAAIAQLTSQHMVAMPGFHQMLIVTLQPDNVEGVHVAFGRMEPDIIEGRLTGTGTIYHLE
jgi:hypothetical protein